MRDRHLTVGDTVLRRERNRRYAATENGSQKTRAAQARFRASEQGKAAEAAARQTPQFKARTAANNASRSGKLVPQPCEGCGTAERVQKHHHHGYEPEHWLCVRWLCRPCHEAEHLS